MLLCEELPCEDAAEMLLCGDAAEMLLWEKLLCEDAAV